MIKLRKKVEFIEPYNLCYNESIFETFELIQEEADNYLNTEFDFSEYHKDSNNFVRNELLRRCHIIDSLILMGRFRNQK